MSCGDQCAVLVPQLLIYGLTNGAVVALNAVGFTLAYAVARQINLAHGNVFALTTVAVASLARALEVTAADPPLVRVALVILLAMVGAICGAFLNWGGGAAGLPPVPGRA
jgi:branched-subunit amino acid ABC-type transport system permease component